jgi:hypothetical protein
LIQTGFQFILARFLKKLLFLVDFLDLNCTDPVNQPTTSNLQSHRRMALHSHSPPDHVLDFREIDLFGPQPIFSETMQPVENLQFGGGGFSEMDRWYETMFLRDNIEPADQEVVLCFCETICLKLLFFLYF